MSGVKKIHIAEGVSLNFIDDKKYKTVSVSMFLSRKLSRSEINNYNRQKINDARDKMNVKYSDADYVCSPEDELIIEQARQRIAEKYGDTYEN